MTKYKARAVTINGQRFSSRAEGAFYLCHILPGLAAGKIRAVELQPRIKLTIGGKHLCHYIADFKIITDQEQTQIIEIKGYKTDIYTLKIKATRLLYPALDILEISAKALRSEILLLRQLILLASSPGK